jgi:sugar phosphate isomerase/epimerase
LKVVSAIGFPRWAVDDDQQRAEGMEQFKRDMDLVAQIGGTHIAAPPAGINRTPGVDLRKVADRYRVVLELGRAQGIVPQLEIWGSAQTLGTVSEAVFVTSAADHPDACLLLDVFHMYKGGSGFHCLKLLNGAAMHAFHINDYPADPPREEANDSHRVYPGDGVAPMDQILRTLHMTGFRGMLSLELFNRDYWKQDPLTVAKTGLAKTRAAVERALS